MASVKLNNVNKVYDNNVQAVFDFNLEIKDGEFVVFVGPSGCGKSTTLRMIAGLEEITDGDLYINDVLCNDVPAKKRDVAMVFQNYALYPHMSVYENIAFGLKNRHVDKKIIDERVHLAAKILGIEEYLDRKPKALSGGQCQRVALGRAIVRHAQVFLMDEPLSNLDAKLRVQMRSELIKLHEQIGGIIIYVTHDQTEAMTMADRIVVMSKGHIQQIGTPREIYNNPANKFVAGFMGSPTMNFIDATYEEGKVTFAGEYTLSLEEKVKESHSSFYQKEIEETEGKSAKLEGMLSNYKSLGKENSDAQIQEFDKVKEEYRLKIDSLKAALSSPHPIIFGIRPEDISLCEEKEAGAIKAKIDVVELLGKEQILHVLVNEVKIDLVISSKINVKAGNEVFLKIDVSSAHLYDKDNEKAIL